jgi:hypothetical protein
MQMRLEQTHVRWQCLDLIVVVSALCADFEPPAYAPSFGAAGKLDATEN